MIHIDIWKLPFSQIQPEFDRIYNEGLLKPSSWERMALSEFTELTLTSKEANNELCLEWIKLGIYIQDKLTINETNRNNLHSILYRGFTTRLRTLRNKLCPMIHSEYGLQNLECYFQNCLLQPRDAFLNLPYDGVSQAKKMIEARQSSNTDLADTIKNEILENRFVFNLISLLDDIDETLFSPEFQIQEWRAARARYHQKEVM